ncbi:MAG: hypothetical protein K2Q18_02095 [Bdellovibrionales bacterium]|nr:hypothetical protein [Bdellovibrionales bacterium]
MTAMYLNNFKKIQKFLAKSNSTLWHFDPRAYPNHEHEFPHSSLWHGFDPWKDTYASPLTHLNVYQVTVAPQIYHLPMFLVRDGLFTWLDFLNRCPNPKHILGILLLHKSLRDYVPSLWRPRVIFYEFEYRPLQTSIFQEKNGTVLIKANVTNGMFDYDHAIKKVLELRKAQYKKFVFFFFNRSNPFLVKDWDNDYRNQEFATAQSNFLEFLKKEKIDFEFLTWKEYFHIQGTHQFDCYDLNYKEKYYIDDFSNYHFLKKGATPALMQDQAGDKADLYIPLSAFHGVRVLAKEPNHDSKKVDEILKNLKILNIAPFHKFDTGAFFMAEEISGKKLESAWFKTFR